MFDGSLQTRYWPAVAFSEAIASAKVRHASLTWSVEETVTDFTRMLCPGMLDETKRCTLNLGGRSSSEASFMIPRSITFLGSGNFGVPYLRNKEVISSTGRGREFRTRIHFRSNMEVIKDDT